MLEQKVGRTKFEKACQQSKASFGGSGTSCGLRRMTWTRLGMGCSLPSMSFKWSGIITSQGELRESKEELRAVNGELRDKVTLLDGARREASEATISAKRLTEECHGLHGDLHQQITLVAQRDEVIGRLRDQASARWASRWLAFQQRAVDVYPGLDFNFDLPSDEEVEESFSANYSQEPGTPAEAHSPSSPSVPPADA